MASPFREPSIEWFDTCQKSLTFLRGRFGTLSPNASLWYHPSVEAALVEWSLILLDRNRELGSGKTHALIGEAMDPSLRLIGQTLSAQGIAVRTTSSEDLATAKGSELILIAVSEDDRFTTELYDLKLIEARLADSNFARVPQIRVRFHASAAAMKAPKPYEIAIYRLENGTAFSLLGDRVRLEPRVAPHSMSARLVAESWSELTRDFKTDPIAIVDFETQASQMSEVSTYFAKEIENRTFTHAVLKLKSLDSSNVALRLCEMTSDLQFNRDVLPLSACEPASLISDLRTQEWLLARDQSDPQDLRGRLLISASAIQKIGVSSLVKALGEIVSRLTSKNQ